MMKTLMQLRHDARRLWSTRAQQVKWLRGIQLARASRTGWLLDAQVQRRVKG